MKKQYKVIGHVPIAKSKKLAYHFYPSNNLAVAFCKVLWLRFIQKAVYVAVHNEYKDYCCYSFQSKPG